MMPEQAHIEMLVMRDGQPKWCSLCRCGEVFTDPPIPLELEVAAQEEGLSLVCQNEAHATARAVVFLRERKYPVRYAGGPCLQRDLSEIAR